MMPFQKSAALLALDDMNARFKEVKRVTGNKVKRGSENDKDAKHRRFLRETTWDKMAAL